MAEPQPKAAETAMTPAPRLSEVRVYTAEGEDGRYGSDADSLTFDELVTDAANSMLDEAGSDLSDYERSRWLAFAQVAGSRAIEAASTHMGEKGWMKFTYLGNDPGGDDERVANPARTYGINQRASWYPERTVARPAEGDHRVPPFVRIVETIID